MLLSKMEMLELRLNQVKMFIQEIDSLTKRYLMIAFTQQVLLCLLFGLLLMHNRPALPKSTYTSLYNSLK